MHSQHLLLLISLIVVILMNIKQDFTTVSIFISQMTSDFEIIFACLLAIHVSIFVKCLLSFENFFINSKVFRQTCIVISSSYNLFSFNLLFLVYLISRFSPTSLRISSVKKCAFLLLSKEFSILLTNDNHLKILDDYVFKHGRNISNSYWAVILCHFYCCF